MKNMLASVKVLLLVSVSALYTAAATITVTNINDSGPGSLRQAIADATPGSTINFDTNVFSSAQTIILTSGHLIIDKNLTIQGLGANLLSISGNHASTVFFISNGPNEPEVTLNGMTIKDADHTSSEEGGGISNYGHLTVTDCTISGNSASNGHGGGVWNQSFAQMTVTNSTISGNGAYYDGGGIRNDGSLVVTNSIVTGNAAGGGGGVSNWRDLAVSNSIISGNSGGAIHNSNGALTVINSTISGNGGKGIETFGYGGPLIGCHTAAAHILNSTISENTGTGIYSEYDGCGSSLLDVTNSTIFGNSGGGISDFDVSILRNTIVVGNTEFGSPADISVGAIETASHNLICDAGSSGGIQNGVNGNIVGVNPLLGPLRNNGGPTMTHSLLAGSPAINAGDNCVLIENGCVNGNPALTTDQRGMPRNGNVDIGAFERQPSDITSVAPFDFDGDGKTDFTIYRPGEGSWWERRSLDQTAQVVNFGAAGDVLVPADYTGDGKTDVAIYRPSTGEWFIDRSEDGSYYGSPFGTSTDIPVPADYDGDGRADVAVYRPSTGVWYILRSSNGQVDYAYFGAPTDQPVPADYDGDGRADVAIVRNLGDGNKQWWVQGSSAGVWAVNFGVTDDKAVPGDYTGDGKADIAVFRSSTGTWYVFRSEDSSYYGFPWGMAGDIPVPGDYDGDGKIDAAVFRPSDLLWYVNRSDAQGYMFVPWGAATDIQIPSVYTK